MCSPRTSDDLTGRDVVVLGLASYPDDVGDAPFITVVEANRKQWGGGH